MTHDEIREVRAELSKMYSDVIKWMDDLHARCTHPGATKKHRSNTGNYDPYADRYWIEYTCPDCGNYWTADKEAHRMGMK